MAAVQMIDLLKRGEQFHKDLADYYENLESHMRREEVRRVLEYMSWHERCLEHCFHDYEKSAPQGVAHAWFKGVPDINLARLLDEARIAPDASVDDVLQLALRVDDALIEIYKFLRERTMSEELKEVLDQLMTMEREEEKRMAWSLQRV